MATATGVLFTAAMLLSPRHGVLARLGRRLMLINRILCEDVLAVLYRAEEKVRTAGYTSGELANVCHASSINTRLAVFRLTRTGRLSRDEGLLKLTERGRQSGQRLVRSHRLWESYLQSNTNLPADHVHATAERLEHLTDDDLRAQLAKEAPGTDPHGKPIPNE
ncbi:MAG TPA: iron dependent repressor, metal binding and dimerization domain protein, partial [Tepidisphaeraceae bacterium]